MGKEEGRILPFFFFLRPRTSSTPFPDAWQGREDRKGWQRKRLKLKDKKKKDKLSYWKKLRNVKKI